jgi:hypothetical protein
MIQRLYSILRGEDCERVHLSETGRRNVAHRVALAGYYADRALLLWSCVWLAIRWFRYTSVSQRPEVLYDPLTWLGALVFPTPPSEPVWYALFVLCFVSIVLCLWRPQLIPARVALAACALLLMTPEFAHGHIEHINHLFLVAHTLAIFLPLGRPAHEREAILQAEATEWYLAALLFPYMMAGVWKWVDMTIRQVVKPGMTWLHPDALAIVSTNSHRQLDLPLDFSAALVDVGPLAVVGYVTLASIFLASSIAAFRRPLLFIILPVIVTFHVVNFFTLNVLFLTTCIVAAVLFTPYELLLPGLRRQGTPVARVAFEGAGATARYERRYADGEIDIFLGFYAYRERLRDRSPLVAAPLYYPGLGWVATRLLALKNHATITE